MFFLLVYCLLLLLSISSGSWRLSISALGIQAFGMGITLISEGHLSDHHYSIAIAELCLIKGIAVPGFLAIKFRNAKIARFVDLIPENIFHWTVATCFVYFSFFAASKLSPGNLIEITRVGAALSAVALGMLALSSQNYLPGQLISLLTIENGISLFYIGESHETPWVLEVFVALDFVVLIVLASSFLRRLSLVKSAPSKVDVSRAGLTADYGDIL